MSDGSSAGASQRKDKHGMLSCGLGEICRSKWWRKTSDWSLIDSYTTRSGRSTEGRYARAWMLTVLLPSPDRTGELAVNTLSGSNFRA